MIEFITQHWDEILLGITSLVTVASVIAKLTPTEADNRIVDKIIQIINTLALNPKKPQ